MLPINLTLPATNSHQGSINKGWWSFATISHSMGWTVSVNKRILIRGSVLAWGLFFYFILVELFSWLSIVGVIKNKTRYMQKFNMNKKHKNKKKGKIKSSHKMGRKMVKKISWKKYHAFCSNTILIFPEVPNSSLIFFSKNLDESMTVNSLRLWTTLIIWKIGEKRSGIYGMW